MANRLKGFESLKTVGQTDSSVADILTPHVSSAFYCIWTRKPSFVNGEDLDQMTRVLLNKVTMPGLTLGTAEAVNGFSGAGKAIAPSTIELANDITLGFNEQQGLVVFDTIRDWVHAIRDPQTGLSSVADYSVRNISGDLLVILTKPVLSGDASVVDKGIFFTNVYPTSVPYDVLSPSKEASDKVQYDVQFKFKAMIDNTSSLSLAQDNISAIAENISTWDAVSVSQ